MPVALGGNGPGPNTTPGTERPLRLVLPLGATVQPSFIDSLPALLLKRFMSSSISSTVQDKETYTVTVFLAGIEGCGIFRCALESLLMCSDKS